MDQVLEGIWAKLSEVAVKGAQHNSRERQPHPKCLQGTRVDLLKYIHELLDDPGKNQLIWLHGTAGVGKSAVAFTVADKMKDLKVTKDTKVEMRLAGTFFFSRKHTKRCTAGYFFSTLVYQLVTNFPSIRKDVCRIIHDNPALLDPDAPLCDQMKTFFLRPLQIFKSRLCGCPPLSFVIDALDECTSEPEVKDLILFLARALREPDLPVTHILLTSRSETYLSRVFQNDEVRPLVREIPVRTSGEGGIISLDGADVDNDICTFLRHSFKELESRHPDFPQPSEVDLAKLASRAGRRFIVASTMMKFIIDDEDSDPHDRLQLMLELTSELLPGTEVYKLYDRILSTCADPKRAYLHLSIVAALADPLPISLISTLLGPGLGRDVQTTLIQLRSVMDIPTDTSLPVNISHSSVRDYVSDPSNCSLPYAHDLSIAHSLLADSSFRLMMKEIPESTALLDALSELKKQSRVMQPEDPKKLKDSLVFLVQPPEPLSVLISILWVRGDRTSDLQFWLETEDGSAWLQTHAGYDWLRSEGGEKWLENQGGQDWLETKAGLDFEESLMLEWQSDSESSYSSETQEVPDDQLQTQEELWTHAWQKWLPTQEGLASVRDTDIWGWFRIAQAMNSQDWLRTQGGLDWLQTQRARDWLQTQGGLDWPQTQGGLDWLQTQGGLDWLQTKAGRGWLQTQAGQEWLQTRGGQDWLQTWEGQDWLQTQGARDWLKTEGGLGWLKTEGGLGWLKTKRGLGWLQTQAGQGRLLIQATRLQTPGGLSWLQTEQGQGWLQTQRPRYWLQTRGGQHWLQTWGGQDWLQTWGGQDWLQTRGGQDWLQTQGARDWLQAWGGQDWLQTQGGQDWLQTQGARDWLQTHGGQDWLQTQGARDWLQTHGGHNLLQTHGGQTWLQTWGGLGWLQIQGGQDWLQMKGGRSWLQTQGARDWLQTPHGQAWQSTPAASFWATMEEFSSALEAINGYTIVPELPLPLSFQLIQQFKILPDFLMFPAFLALSHQHHSTSALSTYRPPNGEIIYAMNAFTTFTHKAQQRSRLSSDALKYACQNWTIHLSRAPNPRDDTLNRKFHAFWNRHLLSWLERQWCLKGLRSCLDILSEGQKLAKF